MSFLSVELGKVFPNFAVGLVMVPRISIKNVKNKDKMLDLFYLLCLFKSTWEIRKEYFGAIY